METNSFQEHYKKQQKERNTYIHTSNFYELDLNKVWIHVQIE